MCARAYVIVSLPAPRKPLAYTQTSSATSHYKKKITYGCFKVKGNGKNGRMRTHVCVCVMRARKGIRKERENLI